MDIPIESIINIVSLLGGGGVGVFFTWRYQRRKAKAEAKSAEVDMAQKVQDTYEQMLTAKQKEVEDNQRLIEELRQDRDHYKRGYIEFRDQLDKLNKEFREFRNTTEDARAAMKRDIARNGRQIECMRPLLCGREQCPDRVLVPLSEIVEREKPSRRKKAPAITPYGKEAADESKQ